MRTRKSLAATLAVCFGLIWMLAGDIAAQTDTRVPQASDGELVWKFKKGDGWKASADQKMNMVMTVGGNDTKVSSSTMTEMTFAVKDVNSEGVATLDNTMSRMKMENDGPAGESAFDTANPAESDDSNPMAEAFGQVVGKSTEMKMSPDGKIFDVAIPTELAEVFKSNPMLSQLFSKEAVEKMSSQGSIAFPGKSLEVGHQWNSVEELQMGPMNVKTEMAYEYKGVAVVDGKPLHKIVADVKMSFPDGGPGGSDIEIIEQNSIGEFYFDGIKGRMAGATMNQDVKMEISVAGQAIDQELKQKLVMKYEDAPVGSTKQ